MQLGDLRIDAVIDGSADTIKRGHSCPFGHHFAQRGASPSGSSTSKAFSVKETMQ